MRPGKLIILALLGVGAFMVYRAIKPSKPAAKSSASISPADWVKAGSQQDAMLAAQTAGM